MFRGILKTLGMLGEDHACLGCLRECDCGKDGESCIGCDKCADEDDFDLDQQPTSVIEQIKASGSRESLNASRDLESQDVLTSRKLD